MGNDGGITGPFGHLDGGEGFAEGADLVDLDEDGIADAIADAAFKSFRIGDEEVIANQLYPIGQGSSQAGPAVPIVFVDAVFDRDDRIAGGQVSVKVHHRGGAAGLAVGPVKGVFAVAVELARGSV